MNNILLSVPGSIIKRMYSNDSNYMTITFCEDNFKDENGNLYIMEAVVNKELFKQNRILVSYDDFGNRYIEPIDGENWAQVGVDIPNEVSNLDYSKIKNIVHRNALKLSSEKSQVSQDEMKKNVKNAKYKKGRFIVAGICMMILWFIIIGLITIFTFPIIFEVNEIFAMSELIIGFILWIIASIFSMKFSLKIPIIRLQKMNYKSDFLYMGCFSSVDTSGFKTLYVSGVVKEEGEDKYTRVNYQVALGSEIFLYDIREGTIMNRYSSKDIKSTNDVCMFIKK